MDVLAAVKASVRRWYISVPVLVIALVAAALGFLTSQSAWQANGTLLVLTPTTGDENNQLATTGGTNLMSNLLAENLGSDTVVTRLDGLGATGAFAATTTAEQLPLVKIAAQGRSAAEAERTLGIVMQNADGVLGDLQHDVGILPQNYFHAVRGVPDSTPKFAASSRLIGAAGIAGAGLVLAMLLASVGDGVLDRRAARKAAAAEAAAVEGPDEAPTDDPAEGDTVAVPVAADDATTELPSPEGDTPKPTPVPVVSGAALRPFTPPVSDVPSNGHTERTRAVLSVADERRPGSSTITLEKPRLATPAEEPATEISPVAVGQVEPPTAVIAKEAAAPEAATGTDTKAVDTVTPDAPTEIVATTAKPAATPVVEEKAPEKVAEKAAPVNGSGSTPTTSTPTPSAPIPSAPKTNGSGTRNGSGNGSGNGKPTPGRHPSPSKRGSQTEPGTDRA